MNASTAILGFTLTALLLTLTPGLDTALVLRTVAVEGGRKAMRAGGGIVTGEVAYERALAHPTFLDPAENGFLRFRLGISQTF